METSSEFRPPPIPEGGEKFKHYDVLIVTPGFESNQHRSGLHWDTRLRLLAAAIYYKAGLANKIIVGGTRIREMEDSFANLMKEELRKKYDVPEDVIETEEYTFDTSSQVEWASQNIDKNRNVVFITDPEQGKHIKALLGGFNLRQVPVLSTEDIIAALVPNRRYKYRTGAHEAKIHFERFFKRLHKSPYWWKWKIRERFLAAFTGVIDPRGKIITRLTRSRQNP